MIGRRGARTPTYSGWFASTHDRRLEFRVAAEKTVYLLPAVVIAVVHPFTFHA